MSIKQEDIDLATFEGDHSAAMVRKRSANVDFKMVTFTLAGKRYGIDIMKVKEIRRAGNFTYVPNTEPYVRGVDNLRGDIIPIIDMRLMFSLPITEVGQGGLENVIVLRFDELIIGLVVDTVEKVVGVMKVDIRPPHPLFGDINIRYISGIIEENKHLYVILSVDDIFVPEAKKVEPEEVEEEKETIPIASLASDSPMLTASAWQTPAPSLEVEDTHVAALALWESGQEEEKSAGSQEVQAEERETASRMVGLLMSLEGKIGVKEKEVASLLEEEENFYLTPLNTAWFLREKGQWQNGTPSAKELLKSFYSPFTASLWSDEYLEELSDLIKDNLNPELVKNVLIPGCGEGHDAYVVTYAIKRAFGNIRYRVWASDNNLMHIMNTQSLSYSVEAVPGVYMDYMLNTSSGLQFDSDIKESILFEYSDITKATPNKQVGLIVAYDLLSFLSAEDQVHVLKNFATQLDENGLLIVGYNESVDSLLDSWVAVPCDKFKVYKKQKN